MMQQTRVSEGSSDPIGNKHNDGSPKTSDLKSLFPSHEQMMRSLAGEPPEQEETNAENLPEKDVSEAELSPKQSNEESATKEKHPQKRKNSPEEERALDKGWKPKEEWKGDEKDWKPARTFLDQREMLEQIGWQRKEMDKMRKDQRELINILKKRDEASTEEKANDILLKKREAISAGDVETAEAYENQYHEIKQDAVTFKDLQLKTEAKSEVPPEAYDFIERNKSWYNTETAENSAMMQYAVQKDSEMIQRYPHWPTERRLEEVERMVKRFFADKFENPERNRASLVGAASRKPVADPDKITYHDLPPEAKAIVDSFLKRARPNTKKGKGQMMTRDQYAQRLLQNGAVRHE